MFTVVTKIRMVLRIILSSDPKHSFPKFQKINIVSDPTKTSSFSSTLKLLKESLLESRCFSGSLNQDDLNARAETEKHSTPVCRFINCHPALRASTKPQFSVTKWTFCVCRDGEKRGLGQPF